MRYGLNVRDEGPTSWSVGALVHRLTIQDHPSAVATQCLDPRQRGEFNVVGQSGRLLGLQTASRRPSSITSNRRADRRTREGDGR
jgi:hypothetical protein